MQKPAPTQKCQYTPNAKPPKRQEPRVSSRPAEATVHPLGVWRWAHPRRLSPVESQRLTCWRQPPSHLTNLRRLGGAALPDSAWLRPSPETIVLRPSSLDRGRSRGSPEEQTLAGGPLRRISPCRKVLVELIPARRGGANRINDQISRAKNCFRVGVFFELQTCHSERI